MSLTSVIDKTGPVTITGLPQTIPVGFPFAQASDLLVLDAGAGGTGRDPAVALVLGSDFSVTGGGYNAANQMQTGSIVVVNTGTNVVLVNDYITIMRGVAVNQTSSFTATGPLTVQLLEQALDKNASLSQQVNEIGGRSLQFERCETLSPTLNLTARKGNVLGFDSNGNIAYYIVTGTSIQLQSLTGTAGQVLVNGGVGPVTGNVTLTLANGTPTLTGTANQVLVNGGVGPVSAGSITLTLPQSINSTATPQFAKLGLGTTAQSTDDLHIARQLPPGSGDASVVVGGAISAPGATQLFPNAFRDSTQYTASTAADAYTSYDANATLLGSIALNHYYGYQARQSYQGSNTLSVMSGYTVAQGVSSGTVTEMRGYYVPDQTVAGGTVTHFAGIFIDQLTAGTTRHAIYHNGTDPWFSAGGQIFTSALLTPPAGATTCVLGGTFNQTSQTGLAIMNSNATATGTFASFCNSGGTVQGTITQTNSTTTAYNTTSDARLKTNIKDLAGSGSIIDALKPRLFDWVWGGKDSMGFIAQELNEVYPAAVTQGNDDAMWQVDFSKLIPVLTAEIKSLRMRVAELDGKT